MTLNHVRTKYGIVAGTEESGYTAFKGVPFAKPPVGQLRFMAPQRPEPWEGELQCTEYPKACVPLVRIIFPDGSIRGHKEAGPAFSEDCLYLNIWTPAKSADEKLPVMLWIYGGGFGSGYSASPTYQGDEICKSGVILVSCNYRCGALGFISHPALTARDPSGATGNYGLLDQIAALDWIRENIAAFGGNPENITIFGQSAGGMSTKFLLASPLSRGKFAHAVIQSGGGLNGGDPTRPYTKIAELTQIVMDRLGWTVEDLLTRDAVEVNQGLYEAANKTPEGHDGSIYQPCIDTTVLPELPERLIMKGEYGPADIICGTVNGDAGMFCRLVRAQANPDAEMLRAFSLAPQYSLGRWFCKNSFPKIRGYYFEKTQNERGTPHGSEIPYIFGTLDRRGRAYDESDTALSGIMMRYWTNFAKTGDPNGEGLPYWPEFDEDEKVLHVKDDGITAENAAAQPVTQRVIEYTIAHPGMLESLEGF